LNEEFKAELRNVIRFMNSENVEIDEEIIKQFDDKFPFEEPEPIHGRAVEELDREIWAALADVKVVRYIGSLKTRIEGDTVFIEDTRSWNESIHSLDETTKKLCSHIDELIRNKQEDEAFKRAGPKK